MYRLLIVNNPVTALFMAMQLENINAINSPNNVILYESRILPDNYCDNPKEYEKEAREFCLKPFCTEKIIDLPSIYYHYSGFWDYIFMWPHFFIEQRKNLKKLDKCLSSLNWRNNVVEIWYGNTMWQSYLKKYNSDAKLFLFDHGLTETNEYLMGNKKFLRLKSSLKRLINFFYPVAPFFKPNRHLSLNADIINRIVGPDVAGKIILRKQHKRFFSRLHAEKYALILLENIKPWSSQRSDNFKYFQGFEEFLVGHLKPVLQDHEINTIIFKSKHWHHEFAAEAVKNFSHLRQSFQVYYLSDLHPNVTAEYFMLDPNMRILVGNLSSGLIFAKSLNPNIKTYTYDRWFTSYTLGKFGKTYNELLRMREWYFKVYLWAFSGVNPNELHSE